MTIYNNINNISEDYAFVLSPKELFYEISTFPTSGIFKYDNDEWVSIALESSIFEATYENIKEIIKLGFKNTQLINVQEDFLQLIAQIDEDTEIQTHIFLGCANKNLMNFPIATIMGEDTTGTSFTQYEGIEGGLENNQYFYTIFTENDIYCCPVKTFSFYSNIRVPNDNDYTVYDYEYLSAQQTHDMIYNAITKMQILEVVETLPSASEAKTNCIYLKHENTDDGINFDFGVYIFDTDNSQFQKLDTLTFDINLYSLDTHTHGNISRNGAIGSTANKPLITGASGRISVGSFGSSNSVSSTEFVSCADTRLSNTRIPTAHATSATTYGIGTNTTYGHNKVINHLNTATYNDGESLSAYQGYLLNESIGQKVDKITGKQLSTEDYTTAEKTKLANINIVDTVTNGNTNAVTSNAVYDYIESLIGDIEDYIIS